MWRVIRGLVPYGQARHTIWGDIWWDIYFIRRLRWCRDNLRKPTLIRVSQSETLSLAPISQMNHRSLNRWHDDYIWFLWLRTYIAEFDISRVCLWLRFTASRVTVHFGFASKSNIQIRTIRGWPGRLLRCPIILMLGVLMDRIVKNTWWCNQIASNCQRSAFSGFELDPLRVQASWIDFVICTFHSCSVSSQPNRQW